MLRRRQTLLTFMALFCLCVASARTYAAYVVETVSGTAFDSTSSTVTWNRDSSLTGYPRDDDFQLVNIGFTFYLGQTGYTQVRILSNGALHFGADQGFYKDYTNEALPIEGACTGTCPGYEEPADRAILGYWDDLEPSLGGSVTYSTLGSAPNRRFVASWNGVPRYNGAGTSYSLQIVLYENGNVLFRYGNDNANGASATIGIEVDNSDYTQYSFDTVSVNDATDLLWRREFPALSAAAASCTTPNQVTVDFAAPVSPARAVDVSNYSLDNGASVLSASLVDSDTVLLTTSSLSLGVTYTLQTTYPTQSLSFSLDDPTSADFSDDFSSGGYSGGSGAWSGSWQEVDDNGSASSGFVRVSGGAARFNGYFSFGYPGLYREVDLSSYSSATLTYSYSTTNNLEGSDSFGVEVSANGGSSYTVVASYSNEASGTATIDLTPYLSANTRIRFRISSNYNNYDEFMYIDNVTIAARGAPSACGFSAIAIWRMEDEVWNGSAGEVSDASGNNLSGRAYNGAQTLDAAPAIASDPGTCAYAEFDGSSQYIEIADNNLLDITDNLTVSAWVYPTQIPTSELKTILSKDENYEFHIDSSGEIYWWWNDSSGTSRSITTSGANMVANAWRHVVITYESGAQRVYVDGVVRGSSSYTGTLLTNSDPLQIGQDQGYSVRYFSGRIDEVQIYNKTLSATDVGDLYVETHPCEGSGACLGTFPDAISSHSTGTISFGYNSQVIDSPDNILEAGTVSVTGSSSVLSCTSTTCVASGGAVDALNPGTFPDTSVYVTDLSVSGAGTLGGATNQYRTVSVSDASVMNVSSAYSEYFINQLSIGYQGKVNLQPGDYWINQLTLGSEVEINVTGSGTARLFVNQSLSIGYQDYLNAPGGSPSNASRLLLYAYGNVIFSSAVTFSGVLYSAGDVSLGYQNKIYGAITAEDVSSNSDVDVTYNSGSVSALDYGALCSVGALNRFIITTGSTASTCLPHTVRIEAQDSSGATLSTYAGTVALSTSRSRGVWAVQTGAGTLSPDPDSSDDGAAAYTFSAADAGVAELTLSNNLAESLTLSATDTDASISGVGGPIQFLDNILYIEENDSLDYDLIAGRRHNFKVSLIAKDPGAAGSCGPVEEYDGGVNLKAWLTRSSADPAGVAPQIVGNSTATLPDSQPASANLNLSFTSGEATFAWDTSDVGAYVLNLRDDSSGLILDESDNPLTIASDNASAPWIVRPFVIRVDAVGNPAATGPSGGAYRKAGADFTLNVGGLLYQTADDLDGDGQADAGADLSGNGLAPAFGNEGETVQLSVSSIAPAPNGALSGDLSLPGGSTLFSGGQASGVYQFSEVGVINLSAVIDDSNYLGAGSARTAKISGASGDIGRFYPAYLAVSANTPTFTPPWACAFTYQDQSFPYDVSPVLTLVGKNVAGATTLNYDAAYFKFSNTLQSNRSYSDASGRSSILSFDSSGASLSLSTGAAYDGSGTLSLSGDVFTYQKTNSPPLADDDPFAANVNLTFAATDLQDSDGACYKTSDADACLDFAITGIAGTEIRYGRLRMENAYGPETSSLELPMYIEHWNGARFVENASDSCTSYSSSPATLAMSSYSGNLNSGETRAEVAGNPGAGGAFASAVYPDGQEVYLTSPGIGNEGTVGLRYNTDLWLRFDWDGDNSLDNPSATATFGQYRGHDRIIYWREVTQ
ncbi:LamG domain-containing protein [Hahella sp. KA22]|uniref:LamG domain-containing protein n=1 Tax=Hahella sp. KA22 TaxID=1628392 RepID=UPI000FDD58CB|nr:LamG domain-containing protein [Hahella sp. KA22]AZZ94548.1 LamG domain-containing protein [Hahella sp. KA22]QAY57921.1 LamG domain-containing protein [Hahella sp. KA22]